MQEGKGGRLVVGDSFEDRENRENRVNRESRDIERSLWVGVEG